MAKCKQTKKALLSSVIALILCCSMLIGTTFAWFTDSVESGINQILAGNLDVELDYAVLNTDGTVKEWKSVQDADSLFSGNLWEPGHTEVVYLRLSNKGSLALKYQLGINVTETIGINVNGNPFKLSEYIYMGVVENAEPAYTSREAAITAAKGGVNGIIGNGYSKSGSMLKGADDLYLAVVVYMPESVDNNANYKTGTNPPVINLGLNLVATQMGAEFDSFGSDYDEFASVVVEPGESIADAIRNVEDGGIVFLENGEHDVTSGPILIEGKTVTVIGLGNVTINKNYGSTHLFTIMHGAEVVFENIHMDGQGNTREGIYVRWDSKVTLKNCSIKNTGGLDIMIDEASDAAHGEETASYVTLINTDIEDVAMCASPVTSVAATQDTFVYFNYDKASSVGAIDVQSINEKPENVIINGVASTEVGKTMQLYASNDAELAAVLNTIKTDSNYWNKNVIVYLAAGEYSDDYTINQYPQWNGEPGRGTGNNYQGGVPAGAPGTVITFVGEPASTYSLRGAQAVPGVIFTGNVTVNGFGDSGAGFTSATSVTTFQNVLFTGENIAPNADGDIVALNIKNAACNVNFDGCVFEKATHISIGESNNKGVGSLNFVNCTFNDGGCLSGYYRALSVTDCVVNGADNGFINTQSDTAISIENCTINAGKYLVRTKSTGAVLTVKDCAITMYESEGSQHLVYFRGGNESAEFVDCDITAGYTTAGVDADSELTIYNDTKTADGLILRTDGLSDKVTFLEVPEEYEGTTVIIPEGVDAIANYAFDNNSNVKVVVLASTVRDLGRGFDSSAVEKVVLNEGLTTISSRAFKSTTNLKEVVISSTVTEIADDAFQKTGLKTIRIPASVERVGAQAFGASQIETVIFEGDTTIENKAFRGCAALRTVYMNGNDITFVNTTGQANCWFCNSESSNPKTSTITFYVKNPIVEGKVRAAMGRDIENVTFNCESVAKEYDATEGGLFDTIQNLQSGETLIIPGGVYVTTGSFKVPAGVTIMGKEGEKVVFRQNSAAQDDLFQCAGDVLFYNVVFESNRKGYAVTDNTKNHDTNGDITIINCEFVGIADEKNWGVYKNVYGDLTIKNCSFTNYNNAICGVKNGDDSATVIAGCTFTNINGEAIGYVESAVPVDFEANVIANNTGLTAENVIGY